VVFDITERKKAEEALHALNQELELKVAQRTEQLIKAQDALVQKEKLAVLGQLAGTVGHEIRNPLGVISNAVFFLKTSITGADDIVTEYLDIIKMEVEQAQRIINDLCELSRERAPQKNRVVVDALIAKTLCKCTVPGNIEVRTKIPHPLPEVFVDSLQMGQVLQNLFINAVQAMSGGGILNIAAGLVHETMPETDDSGEGIPGSATEFVEITITDTGEGISPENMKMLFQPLFTTRAKGIGMGLFLCRNLVESNGGRIEAESRRGDGATFRVRLPFERDDARGGEVGSTG
jgi:signal transduction histidine kinase